MIIVLSFDARDGASAKRLAARYNEVIVIKDEVLETKRYNLSAATPISQRDELAHLTRITIIGHSNSTNKFGKYNVTQFSNFIYEILKANATGLTELTAIDLFGCEVGRIEFVAQKSDQSSVTARDFKSDVSTAQFRSFVRDFVTELIPMLAEIDMQNDINVYAFSTPDGTLFHKTLLYEDETSGTWLYLGLNAEQYEHFNNLEQEEKAASLFYARNQKIKTAKERALDLIQDEIEQETDENEKRTKFAKAVSLKSEILLIGKKIQSDRDKTVEKHLTVKNFLLENATHIIPETDNPRQALVDNVHFCRYVIPGKRAEEKSQVSSTEELIAAQIDLKERLATEKSAKNKINTSMSGNVHPIDGDGNCFFSAVAYELARQGLDSYTHQTLRAEAVEYLHAHPEIFTNAPLENDEEIETYLTRMGRDREYADMPIIIALAQRLNIQLTIMRAAEHGAQHMSDINQVEGVRGRAGLLHRGENWAAHYDALELDNTIGHSMANQNSIL